MSGIKVKEIFKWPYKSARQVKMEDNWFSLRIQQFDDGYEKVLITDKSGAVTQDDKIISTFDEVRLHSGAAIEVAKGILKHFDIDYNGYEENISERYRSLTDAEIQQAIKDNPNIIPITIDPNSPVTSELSYRLKDDDECKP